MPLLGTFNSCLSSRPNPFWPMWVWKQLLLALKGLGWGVVGWALLKPCSSLFPYWIIALSKRVSCSRAYTCFQQSRWFFNPEYVCYDWTQPSSEHRNKWGASFPITSPSVSLSWSCVSGWHEIAAVGWDAFCCNHQLAETVKKEFSGFAVLETLVLISFNRLFGGRESSPHFISWPSPRL